jgi:adenylate cyclase
MHQLFFEVDGRPQVYSLLKDEVTVGRSSENDVVLNDFSVSRRHATLTRADDKWKVRDNHSTNGVKINGRSVPDGLIEDGDQLSIGTFTLTLRDDPTITSYPRAAGIKKDSTSTFIRPLAEFNEEFGLEKELEAPGESTVDRKRGVLDLAYKNKIFEILVQVAKTLISADDLATVLEKVMDLIFEYLPVDRGFLLLADENGELRTRVARVKSDRPTGGLEGEAPFSRTIVDMVVRQKVAFLTSDAQSDDRVDRGQSIRIQQIRSAMCVPLWDRGAVIGVIHVDSPLHVGTFKSEDLDLLTALGNFAAVAIERARLHDRIEQDKRIRARLERYHSPAVVEEIIGSVATGTFQRVRTKDVTVLFADVVGFTSMSEKMAPEAISAMLSTFFTHAAEAVFSLDGTLDKFIGDAVMAFFGAPIDQPDHAWRAVSAALRIRGEIEQWNRQREAEGDKPLQVRIAINSGEVVVGEIGSESRVDYTVLGNAVNIASRIEEQAAEPGDIVIGPATYEAVRGRVRTAQLGEFSLKGLAAQVPLYRVLGLSDPDASRRPTVASDSASQ